MNRLQMMAKGVGSALLLFLILAGVPVVLVRVGAFPSSVPDPASLWRAATGPDPSGRAVFVVLAALVWLAWAGFTLSVLRETIAAVRSHGLRPARPLPGLDWSARPAAALIGAILAMVVTGPLLTAAAPQAAAAGLRSTPAGADRPVPTTVATATHHPGAATEVTIAPAAGHPGQGASSHPKPAAAATPNVAVTADHEQATAPPSLAAREDGSSGHTHYTVKRRDTLWSIAERHLGDPLRYRELAALNSQIGPDYEIHPGQVLTLPAGYEATPRGEATQVTVEGGDTLSGIADEHGIADWHAVWAVNAGRAEPGGKRFTNPHHIEVGWQLTVPVTERNPPGAPAVDPSSASPSPSPSPATPEARHGPAVQERDAGTADDQPSPGAPTDPVSSPADPIPAPAVTAPSTGNGSASTESEPVAGQNAVAATAGGLAAGGVVLAAGVFAALALARRQRFRDRRPGRTLASPDPALIPVERASVTVGGPAAAEIARLDEVLRRLGASDIENPHLAAVQLTGGDVIVHLVRQASLPDPWRPTDADGLAWAFPADAAAQAAGADPDHVGAIAPYPTLVHVGSDAASSWLLNLEHTGGLVLTGDPDRCLNLARVMAAQLVLTPWAEAITVTMLGLGQELVDAAPGRLRYAAPADAERVLADAVTGAVRTADLADHHQVTVLDARRRAVADETWAPHVLLVDAGCLAEAAGGTAPAPPALSRLLDLVHTRAAATGTVVVLVAPAPGALVWGAAAAHLDADGTLTLPEAGLRITACGWDADTAAGVGMLLAHLRTAGQEKLPDATGEQPWQAFADAAGALREQLVQPRATPEVHERSHTETCTLPLADDVYVNAAATTREDLQTLAPNVPAELRPQVENADPTLDADVAAWFDLASARAKLTLLGPLTLCGRRPASERPAFYAELTAYLATRPHGASVDQVATAFSLAAGSARSYLSTLRELLGDDPDTGAPYLPHADKSTAGRTRGVNIYQINGLLVDADLFRRLRLRGQARGEAGIDDYVTALRLVTGEPFSQMRDGGGAWLLEGDRHDQHLTHAIVDVAHLVTTRALAAGDTASARAAVDIARLAAPYEEVPRLDTAAVDAAEGHTEQARSSLTDQVCNRSDDGQPPPELNPRTKQILAHHRDWLSHAS